MSSEDELQRADTKYVLVCDDHEPTRVALAIALELAGYKVLQTASVDESLAVLRSIEVLAVVADLHLGAGGDGTTILGACRAWYPHVMRFLLTADLAGEELACEWYSTWIDKSERASFGKLVDLIGGRA